VIDTKALQLSLAILGFVTKECKQPPAGTHVQMEKKGTQVDLWTRELTPDIGECFVNGTKMFTTEGVIKRVSKGHVHV